MLPLSVYALKGSTLQCQPIFACDVFFTGSCIVLHRVLARIMFKRTKKHVATTMTRRLGEIFLVKCQNLYAHFVVGYLWGTFDN
jgi:hypothetical protein